jgi:predicted GNAT family acetyltransferase
VTATSAADDVVHDPAASRFVLRHGDQEIGELTYRRTGDRAELLYTEVRPDLRGRGLGRRLVDAAVRWARAERLKLTPVCGYTRVVLERTAEYRDVL